MERTIQARYVLKKPLLPARTGILYEAADLSLHRNIVVFLSEQPSRIELQEYLRLLQTVAPFSDPRFLHLLDAGSEQLTTYAVLKTYDGEPLHIRLQKSQFSFDDALAKGFSLGKGCLDAMEKGIAGYSLLDDNVWIANDGELKVINYWEKALPNDAGAPGLASLIFQLLTGKSAVPDSLDERELVLYTSLRNEIGDPRIRGLFELLRTTWREQLSLSSFVMELGRFVQKQSFSEPEQSITAPIPINLEGVSTVIYDEDELEEDQEEIAEAVSRPKRRLVRKTLLGIGVVGVTMLTAVVVFMLFLGIDLHWREKAKTTVSEQQTQTPSGQASAGANNTKPAKEANTDNPDSPNGTVPELVGLGKAEAEKKVVAAGYRYDFFIENNAQAADQVFKQSPAPGTALKKGEKVQFWVSKGP